MLPSSLPFSRAYALDRTRLRAVTDLHSDVPPQNGSAQTDSIAHLPGNPAVRLDADEVDAHLTSVLATPVIDEMYDRMWIVAHRDSANIDALSRQRVKNREIVATNEPKLHLTWGDGKVYVQAVPACLLNYDVWTQYLQDQQGQQDRGKNSHRARAVGFLRSYARLVASPLDFALAKEAHLLPDDGGNNRLDWLAWAAFIQHFRRLGDEHVAPRYHYGQLRLSRLNWAVRVFRPRSAGRRWRYGVTSASINDAMARATLPLLFAFAIASSLLSAMQVALAVPADSLWPALAREAGLQQIARAFWVVSVVFVLLLAASVALLVVAPCAALLWQLLWAIRHRKDAARDRILRDTRTCSRAKENA